jgi:serine/threonine protein kinase SCH9
MAFANGLRPIFRAAADDEHDQIGSNSSTPPGAATPRPDLTDKRLPGILHSYFGQVCDLFPGRPKPTMNPFSTQVSSVEAQSGEEKQESTQQSEQKLGGNGLPTAPCSPQLGTSGQDESPPLLPHERLTSSPHPPVPPIPQSSNLSFYPTPPASSSSSIHQSGKEELVSNDINKNSFELALPPKEDGNILDITPTRSRRHTLAHSTPLCSVVTPSTVPAAHISKPSPRHQSHCAPNSLLKSFSASRPSSTPQSDEIVKKLTEGSMPSQNTPPQTPRTRSAEDKKSRTPLAQEKKAASDDADATSVPPPRGQFRVAITEGRGLRPSTDPYVVCQFQWSEYISEGPKEEKKSADINPAAMAIRRSDSDMGRPMAIPMRSRQSSNTGHSSDPKDHGKQVTNPKWDHEAILSVLRIPSYLDMC